MSRHSMETMLPHRMLPVWAIYTRLGYAPDYYPHRHAISDEEQGELDVLVGAARTVLGVDNLFRGAA